MPSATSNNLLTGVLSSRLTDRMQDSYYWHPTCRQQCHPGTNTSGINLLPPPYANVIHRYGLVETASASAVSTSTLLRGLTTPKAGFPVQWKMRGSFFLQTFCRSSHLQKTMSAACAANPSKSKRRPSILWTWVFCL